MTSNIVDVVVIGGGFAGVTAARELTKAGHSVALVEARDRLGGRTFYEHAETLGRSVEMGGTWVHWFQPHLWAELTRYGGHLIESVGAAAPEEVIYRTEGVQKRVSIDEAWPVIEQAMVKYFGELAASAFPRPFEPLFAEHIIKEIDGLSCQDRIDELDELSNAQKDILNAMWSLCCGGLARDGGLATMLRWYALSGNTASGIFDTCTRYKINGGTKSLLDAIIADSAATVRLNAAVQSVTTNDGEVVVALRGGETVRAHAVVVTVPLNVLADIDFSPPLAEAKLPAISAGQMCEGVKLWVRVKTSDRKPLFALAPETETLHYAHTEDIYEDGQLLVVFGPDSTRIADINSVEEIDPHMKRLLGDHVEVVAVNGKAWKTDEFAKGGWSVYRPNQLSSDLSALQQHQPPVFFASGDIANGWNGFIDGAIETGITASAAAAEFLRHQLLTTPR